jgi:hypothetical protein
MSVLHGVFLHMYLAVFSTNKHGESLKHSVAPKFSTASGGKEFMLPEDDAVCSQPFLHCNGCVADGTLFGRCQAAANELDSFKQFCADERTSTTQVMASVELLVWQASSGNAAVSDIEALLASGASPPPFAWQQLAMDLLLLKIAKAKKQAAGFPFQTASPVMGPSSPDAPWQGWANMPCPTLASPEQGWDIPQAGMHPFWRQFLAICKATGHPLGVVVTDEQGRLRQCPWQKIGQMAEQAYSCVDTSADATQWFKCCTAALLCTLGLNPTDVWQNTFLEPSGCAEVVTRLRYAMCLINALSYKFKSTLSSYAYKWMDFLADIMENPASYIDIMPTQWHAMFQGGHMLATPATFLRFMDRLQHGQVRRLHNPPSNNHAASAISFATYDSFKVGRHTWHACVDAYEQCAEYRLQSVVGKVMIATCAVLICVWDVGSFCLSVSLQCAINFMQRLQWRMLMGVEPDASDAICRNHDVKAKTKAIQKCDNQRKLDDGYGSDNQIMSNHTTTVNTYIHTPHCM